MKATFRSPRASKATFMNPKSMKATFMAMAARTPAEPSVDLRGRVSRGRGGLGGAGVLSAP
jgi:hypothetical protein